MIDDKNKKLLLISSILNLFAGVLFVLAAFHVITTEAKIDYTSMLIGIVFLILGLMGVINRK